MQPSFIDYVRNTAKLIAVSRGEVSVDMVRLDLLTHPGPVPQPDHPNAWGSIFRGPGWKQIGTRRSALSSAHGRSVSIWRYVGPLNIIEA